MVWTAIALRAELIYALFSMIMGLPGFMLVLFSPVIFSSVVVADKIVFLDYDDEFISLTGLVLGLSFVVTFLAFYLGNLIVPAARRISEYHEVVNDPHKRNDG